MSGAPIDLARADALAPAGLTGTAFSEGFDPRDLVVGAELLASLSPH